MKVFFLSFCFVLSTFFATPSLAQEVPTSSASAEAVPIRSKKNVSVRTAYTEILPNPDGSLLITEIVDLYAKQQTFDDFSKVFPLFYRNGQNELKSANLQILEVLKNNVPVPYDIKNSYLYKTLLVGDTLKGHIESGGTVSYKIKYVLENYIDTLNDSQYGRYFQFLIGTSGNYFSGLTPLEVERLAVTVFIPEDMQMFSQLSFSSYRDKGKFADNILMRQHPRGNAFIFVRPSIDVADSIANVAVSFKPAQTSYATLLWKNTRPFISDSELLGLISLLIILAYAAVYIKKDARLEASLPLPSKTASSALLSHFLVGEVLDEHSFNTLIISLISKGYFELKTNDKSEYVLVKTGNNKHLLTPSEKSAANILMPKDQIALVLDSNALTPFNKLVRKLKSIFSWEKFRATLALHKRFFAILGIILSVVVVASAAVSSSFILSIPALLLLTLGVLGTIFFAFLASINFKTNLAKMLIYAALSLVCLAAVLISFYYFKALTSVLSASLYSLICIICFGLPLLLAQTRFLLPFIDDEQKNFINYARINAQNLNEYLKHLYAPYIYALNLEKEMKEVYFYDALGAKLLKINFYRQVFKDF